MENGAIASLVGQWNGKIPADSVYSLQEELKSVSDDKQMMLASLPLKSQIVGLILGLFLGFFGADRFYKGDIGLGIVKLLLCWVTLGIWGIVDLFLVWKGIQKR